ncbi:uncharacterized protein [Miscanthus floridulus]|uniref:uncharacterized protein n=1 Tax=Miscanthus floridulus TaxID=154761 RepID=UPI003459D80B
MIAGVSSATTRSCYRTSRGKAHAAPLPAQEPPPKGRKRISMQERRALIVEFVENYRASNEGKFPTIITNICDQIGGSFYTVRPVLQEMVYNHAKLPLDNPKTAPRQVTVEVTEHLMQKDEAWLKDRFLSIPRPRMMLKWLTSCKRRKPEWLKDRFLSIPRPRMMLKWLTTCKRMNPEWLKDKFLSIPRPRMMLKWLNFKEQFKFLSIPKDEGKVLCREDNPKLEESANTGLLGSLKSFAYGIRNFWKNM